MSDVTIKYKGATIATMDATGSKPLKTQGKYCEGDIGVEYVKPAAPSGTKQISITANGTTTEDVAAFANAEITVDVQGGGGSSNWTLLGTQEFTVNTTTTTNKAVGTFTVSGISASKYIFVRIRDKAGKRNGYFYGTDSIGSLYNTVVQMQTVVTHVDSQGNYNGYPNKAGLFPYSFYSDGQIAIYSKYNSSNTGTIDGTFVVEVYALEPPTGKPIFT